MTNKMIMTGVIGILVACLAFLGLEVKNLRAEVTQLSAAPAAVMRPRAAPMLRPKFSKPDDWRLSFSDRWDPYAELEQLHRQMNRLFSERFPGGFWGGGMMPTAGIYDLNTDIKDAKDKYVISMDIPGMEKDKINVEVKNNNLFVSGERSNGNEEQNANYYKQERSFGYFSQSLPLPDDSDASGIAVNYDRGVLTIEIPKLAKANTPQAEANRIRVN